MSAGPRETGHWQPSAEMLRVRRVCAKSFGLTEAELLQRSRVRRISLARQATCYVLRTIWPTLSYPCIAKITGLGDHSTAIHSVRQIAERMSRDAALAAQIDDIVGVMSASPDALGHNAHVLEWRQLAVAKVVERAVEIRAAKQRERELLTLASKAARSDSVFMGVVARGVEAVSATRKVKPANELVDDDADALRRKHASDGLSRAIAAAGGRR